MTATIKEIAKGIFPSGRVLLSFFKFDCWQIVSLNFYNKNKTYDVIAHKTATVKQNACIYKFVQ